MALPLSLNPSLTSCGRFLRARCRNFLLAVLLASAQAAATAAEAQVAVAANFAEPIKAIAAVLQQTTGHTLKITLGSTGKLYAQIKNGAPFDVLLAANASAPEALEKEGVAQPGSRFTYATGKLVLWSADPGKVDASGDILKSPGLRKIAHAAPKVAPYGAAALQAIEKLGLTSVLAPKLVQGESIGQTFSFVHTGNADLGFVALSQVIKGGRLTQGSMWVVPQNLYTPIQQDAVVMQKAANNPAAQALVALLKSPRIQDLIRAHGYAL